MAGLSMAILDLPVLMVIGIYIHRLLAKLDISYFTCVEATVHFIRYFD